MHLRETVTSLQAGRYKRLIILLLLFFTGNPQLVVRCLGRLLYAPVRPLAGVIYLPDSKFNFDHQQPINGVRVNIFTGSCCLLKTTIIDTLETGLEYECS